ncbi:hypothetical protein BD779DRAFT_183977 [Infundibulicybe gibba]|nr:hypothetical protein BD779DRAFT_183977 [Infundibulicybe gibba]
MTTTPSMKRLPYSRTLKNRTSPRHSQRSRLALCSSSSSVNPLLAAPYTRTLTSELDITGGDERKVGYYAGLIVGLDHRPHPSPSGGSSGVL